MTRLPVPTWLAALLLALALAGWLGMLAARPPLPAGIDPPEQLTVERAVLDHGLISLLVRTGMAAPVRVAQVQVDGAYWTFAQEPLGPLPRLSAGWVRIPYPWVYGEAHEIGIVTSRGTVFTHWIAAAAPTLPPVRPALLLVTGLAIGVVPLLVARHLRPWLRGVGLPGGEVAFVTGAGLMAVLLVDTMGAALDCMSEAATAYAGSAWVWLGALATALALTLAGRRLARVGEARALPAALRLGAANLCAALAAGAAVAAGAVSLALLLALTFAFQGTLAGVGLQAAEPEEELWPMRLALPAVAALPALAGAWLGGHAFAPFPTALALTAGAGALLQVVAGAACLLSWRLRHGQPDRHALYGVTAGILLMYLSTRLAGL